MTKVSVIIPVYNVEKYIERNLESLLNQTLDDIEIIYINDCSTDESLSILKRYEEKYENITVIDLEKNSGAAVARNKGLDVAKGEYIGFVDPDDDVDLNYYEELYKKAKAENADIVKCKRKNINLDGQITYNNINDVIKEKGKYYFTYEWTTAIYKSSLIFDNNIRFPEECIKAQDIVFLNRVICVSNKVSLIDNVYYNYYKRQGSLNSSKISLPKIKSAILAHKLILDNYNKSDLYETNKSLYFDLYLRMYNSLLDNVPFQNDEKEAKILCAKAIIENFYNCKDMELFKQNYPLKNIFKFIEEKDVNGLAEVLYKNQSMKKLSIYGEPLIDKVFSIKESHDKKHKILKIFGIKMTLKNKERK